MYDAFGWERPVYIHLQLIMKDAAKKLSKRYGDANFEDFARKGYLPEAILNYIALLGWSPKDNVEKMSLEYMTENFSIDGLSRSSSIFDENKMRWLNSQYVKELPFATFKKLAMPFIAESKAGGLGRKKAGKIAELLHTRTEVLSDIPSLINFIAEFYDSPFDLTLFVNQKWKTDSGTAKTVLDAYLAEEKKHSFDGQGLADVFSCLAEALALKKGQILWCFRIAVTNRAATPGGAVEMAELLGRNEIKKRIKYVLELLK